MRILLAIAAAASWFVYGQAPEAGAPQPEPRYFQYARTVSLLPRALSDRMPPPLRACAVLDAPVFAHALPTLADLRLYAGGQELPYAATISEASAAQPEAARVLNAGLRGGHIVFNLEMPPRAYTDVTLEIDQTDFLATAKVFGLHSLDDRNPTALGTYTLFDLSAQHLSHNTTLPLQETTFPFLFVELDLHAAPGANAITPDPHTVGVATVPPSREAQTVFVTVAESTAIAQRGRDTVVGFDLPAHVPVERVLFHLRPGYTANFSRSVQITAQARREAQAAQSGPGSPDRVSGTIARVRLVQAGQTIRSEQLSVSATILTMAPSGTHVEVAIANGDDRPVEFSSVGLEMRERKLCFDLPASSPVILYYGDDVLQPPVYDYARLFQAGDPAAQATLGAEAANPLYTPRLVPAKALTERHPELLWLGLLAVVGALGFVAFRSARHLPG